MYKFETVPIGKYIVMCADCDNFIYETEVKEENQLIEAENFIPVGNIKKPQPHDRIECPLCKAKRDQFTFYDYDETVKNYPDYVKEHKQ